MNYKIELDDFPEEETYTYLNKDYKTLLLKKSIKKLGSQRLLAEYLGKKLNWYKLRQNQISIWLKRKNLRLDVIYELCKILKINLNKKEINGLKGVQTSIMVFNPKLPISLNKSLAGLIANLYCDGSINKNNSYTGQYTNTCKELREQYKGYFLNSIGKPDYFSEDIYSSKGKKEFGVIRIPSFIVKILYKKFSLNHDHVPNQIFDSDNGIKSTYLRAVFDDEGTVHKEHGQIRLKMKPKSYILDIKYILENYFNIKCSNIVLEKNKYGKRAYYFTISGQYNLRKFYKNICFTHPEKLRKIEKRINAYKQETFGYSAKNFVLNALKSGPKTAKKISKIIKRDKRTVQHHLTNLKKKDLVKFSRLKRKFVYEFLWSLNK